jgi:hypothetical protein
MGNWPGFGNHHGWTVERQKALHRLCSRKRKEKKTHGSKGSARQLMDISYPTIKYS